MIVYTDEMLASHVNCVMKGGQVIFGSLYEEDENNDKLSRTIDADSVLSGVRGKNIMLKSILSSDGKALQFHKIKLQRKVIDSLLEAWGDFGTKPAVVY